MKNVYSINNYIIDIFIIKKKFVKKIKNKKNGNDEIKTFVKSSIFQRINIYYLIFHFYSKNCSSLGYEVENIICYN